MITSEDIINEKGYDIIMIAADATIREALLTMIDNNVGAILVADGEDIIGIWTERDLMHDAVKDSFDPRRGRIRDYMVSPVVTAAHTESVFNLMDKFLGLRISHLLIEKNGRHIGIISVGDAMKATLQAKANDLATLNTLVSWDYYEDWRWQKPCK